MTDSDTRVELIHVHHTETGFSTDHATLMALARWIQREVDTHNVIAGPAPGEIGAVENPLHHLLEDERTQIVRAAGRLELIKLLHDMSTNKTAGPDNADEDVAARLRTLAGELGTTIRCLHHVRENDCILFFAE